MTVARAMFALTILALGGAIRAASPAEPAWPSWRGPLHTGVAPAADPPLRWSEKENVRFKVAVPGSGLASPIVWGDAIYLMSAVPVDEAAQAKSVGEAEAKQAQQQFPPSVAPVRQRFVVLAYSRKDGSLLWERTAVEHTPHESHHVDASWASASPVTDGRILVAHFGSAGTFAYDLEGKLLWKADLGDMSTRNGFGEGSSPAIHGDRVIVTWDHEGESFIVALSAKSGEVLWKTPRPGERTSWATPLVVAREGRVQVVVPATGKSRGYDFATGKELWSLGGMTANTIPSPVLRGSVVYLMSGFRGNMLQAIDLARAEGALEESPAVVWKHEADTPYVPSPLLYDDGLYFLKGFQNILSHLDAASGKPVREPVRLESLHNVYASPVGAAGRIYVFDRDGHATVLRHGKQHEVLAENGLDEGADASPAIVGDTIYLRGQRHLYAIGAPPAAKTAAVIEAR
jgi:outer membrane protein assembly factor BamB